jgi:hypothetical protein
MIGHVIFLSAFFSVVATVAALGSGFPRSAAARSRLPASVIGRIPAADL